MITTPGSPRFSPPRLSPRQTSRAPVPYPCTCHLNSAACTRSVVFSHRRSFAGPPRQLGKAPKAITTAEQATRPTTPITLRLVGLSERFSEPSGCNALPPENVGTSRAARAPTKLDPQTDLSRGPSGLRHWDDRGVGPILRIGVNVSGIGMPEFVGKDLRGRALGVVSVNRPVERAWFGWVEVHRWLQGLK